MAKKNSIKEMIAARTAANVVKSGSLGSRRTYLDRFVEALTDENGEPTPPKTRVEVVADVSYEILMETLENEGLVDEFELTETKDGKFDLMLAEINRKVKSQVASAIADNNNSTSISFNEKYKDVWTVVKDGKNVSLARK